MTDEQDGAGPVMPVAVGGICPVCGGDGRHQWDWCFMCLGKGHIKQEALAGGAAPGAGEAVG